MENDATLDKRVFSTIRKAQVLGASTGLGMTVGVLFLVQTGSVEGGGTLAWCLSYLWELLLWPTFLLFHLFGVPWRTYFPTPVVLWQLCVAVLVNTVLFFVLGTIIGWFVKRKQDQNGLSSGV